MSVLIEGIGVQANNGDIQAAIERAGASYWQKHKRRPTHVSLPVGVDPAGLQLYTLSLARPTGGRSRLVVVGRAVNGDGRL